MKIIVNDKSIYECSVEELKQVQSELKIAWDIAIKRKALQFIPNDPVSFKHKGETVHCRVIKINQKSVNVRTATGAYWNISPNLLTKV